MLKATCLNLFLNIFRISLLHSPSQIKNHSYSDLLNKVDNKKKGAIPFLKSAIKGE